MENDIQKQEYTVMSFNILGWQPLSKEGNRHDKLMRLPLVDKLVNTVKPDSFGLQECSLKWLNLLSPLWEDKYLWVGERNEDGQCVFTPVFYRKDKFRCVDTRTLWLSDTPEVWCSAYERHDNDMTRQVTYAVLENKQTGERYAHFNTHLGITRGAMRKEMDALKLLTDKCKYPFVITADFNVNMDWVEYGTMCGYWLDARRAAARTSDVEVIDYCMLSRDDFEVSEFSVMTEPFVTKRQWLNGDTNGQPYYISDHRPVYVKFFLTDNREPKI